MRQSDPREENLLSVNGVETGLKSNGNSSQLPSTINRLLVLGGDKSMLLRFVRRLFSRKQLFSRKHVYSNYEGQRLSDSEREILEREILMKYFF